MTLFALLPFPGWRPPPLGNSPDWQARESSPRTGRGISSSSCGSALVGGSARRLRQPGLSFFSARGTVK